MRQLVMGGQRSDINSSTKFRHSPDGAGGQSGRVQVSSLEKGVAHTPTARGKKMRGRRLCDDNNNIDDDEQEEERGKNYLLAPLEYALSLAGRSMFGHERIELAALARSLPGWCSSAGRHTSILFWFGLVRFGSFEQ